MLRLRALKEGDVAQCNQFLARHQQVSLAAEFYFHAMIMLVDKDIEGVIYGQPANQTTLQLNYIFIAEQRRHQQMGEALLRAYLHMATQRAYCQARVKCQRLASFFDHIGFEQREGYQMVMLDQFFERPCRGDGHA